MNSSAGRPDKERSTATRSVRTVLVPLDGSPDAQAAIPLAREVARDLGATVCLLHVSENPLDRDTPSNHSRFNRSS